MAHCLGMSLASCADDKEARVQKLPDAAFASQSLRLSSDCEPPCLCPCAEDKEARVQKLSDAAFESVTACYKDLLNAIKDPAARGGKYTQPWLAKGAPRLE